MASDASLPMRLMAIALRKFFNFLGWAGVMFILYGAVAQGSGAWEPLERWVNPVSTLLTLLGTILTATSVYFFSTSIHAPELFSRFISAPLTIAGGRATIGWLFWTGTVPAVMVNGFALLGIAGGLFRIQRNPGES